MGRKFEQKRKAKWVKKRKFGQGLLYTHIMWGVPVVSVLGFIIRTSDLKHCSFYLGQVHWWVSRKLCLVLQTVLLPIPLNYPQSVVLEPPIQCSTNTFTSFLGISE